MQGCSEPKIPEYLSPAAAEKCQYRGIVIHSSQFGARINDILKSVKPYSEGHEGSIVVIGGGKSAQELVPGLALHGRLPIDDIIKHLRQAYSRGSKSFHCL